MHEEAATRIRREESIFDLDLVRTGFEAWMASARRLGPQGQYHEQLSALNTVLISAIHQVRADLLSRSTNAAAGVVYAECRRADRRAALLRRFWRWYADRMDQRATVECGDALAAADEIVRSTWHELFPDPGRRPPTPLPHVALIDMAVSSARDEVPQDLRAPSEPVLARWTALMPLSTIALPPSVTVRPWWLIVIAHECGHQVCAESGPGDSAGAPAKVLAATAERAGADEDEQLDWANWAEELFADAVAAVTGGTAPAWSVMELERNTPDALLLPDSGYPPPVLRWCVADAVAARLGLTAVVSGTDRALLAGSAFAGRHTARLDRVAGAMLDISFGGTTLREIGGRTAQWERTANRWRDALLAGAEPAAGKSPESARLCVAGGALAWRRTIAGAGASADPDRLRRRLLRILAKSRPASVRHTAVPPVGRTAAVTQQILADLRSDAW